MRTLMIVLIIGLLAAACGDSADPETTPAGDTAVDTEEPTPAPSPTPTPPPAPTSTSTPEPTAGPEVTPVAERLQAVLDAWATRPDITGVIARVDDPTGGVQWAGAAGFVSTNQDEPLSAEHPFRIASISKTITSATVLALAERGEIDLEATIDSYLPAALVDTVHVMGDASRGNEVTVRQLLGHTSGIHDYITDPSFVPDVLADPGHVWTPETLVEYAVTHGEAHFLPGEGFHYSDTGYVLLGMIVEQVTEGPLHDAYRTLVFDPLGMEETYLEGFEPARGLTLSHPYLGDFDGLDVHHSLDWSGGGLVSTTADLSRFITALHDGSLLEATTVADMTELQLTEDGGGYQVLHGLGYIGFRAGSFEMVGHDGSWGSFMYTVPETGVTVTGTVNQEQANQLDLVFELLQVLGT